MPSPSSPLPGLALRNAVLAALAIILLTAVVFAAAIPLGLLLPSRHSALIAVVLALTCHGFAAVLTLWFLCRHWKIPPAALRIVPPTPRLWHLCWQIPVALLGLILVQAIVFGVLGAGGGEIPSQFLNDPGIFTSPTIIALVFIGAGIAAPLWEEFFFRGLLYSIFDQKWGQWAAVLLSAVCFSLAHLMYLLFPYLLTFGLVAAFLRIFHGNIWGGLIFHIVINCSVIAMTLGTT
ncbi:CPBP family intramembrane metalloprotease [Corynebacterium poyangense]|uniref:CPBP family intramembrane metalloprotease n=1 Tax=Corynebacterium poyangense TaxID=2684405 RepID=A0A7H0SRQ7_9CORY|nr:type II CAAX endopeptidase family protein [Corynebacterium poyangense]MBZ8176665.1 CPBP family intramembrane metalloprotease [Corynebacterium poyangense]QNQ91232.1 CPBP family intramembrane metalloprotease [Corynebacterium poyangense]